LFFISQYPEVYFSALEIEGQGLGNLLMRDRKKLYTLQNRDIQPGLLERSL
jgi:hypothetical protein